MSCRLATLDDGFKAVKILLNFHKASELPFKTSASWALALFQACVNDEDKVAIIKDGGILLGAVGNSLLGPFKQSHEIVWWVDPDKRGGSLEMLTMYEDWARSKDVSFIEVKSLSKFPETEKIYKKLGFNPLETSWIKVV